MSTQVGVRRGKSRGSLAKEVAEEFLGILKRADAGEELSEDDVERLIEDAEYITRVLESGGQSPERYEVMERVSYFPHSRKCMIEPVGAEDEFRLLGVKCGVDVESPASRAFMIVDTKPIVSRITKQNYNLVAVFNMMPDHGANAYTVLYGNDANDVMQVLGEVFNIDDFKYGDVNKSIECAEYASTYGDTATSVLRCPSGSGKYIVVAPNYVYIATKGEGGVSLEKIDNENVAKLLRNLFNVGFKVA